LNSIRIFSALLDQQNNHNDFIGDHFDELFDNDYVIKAKFGENRKSNTPFAQSLDFIEKHQGILNLVFWSNSVIMEGFRNFITQLENENSDTELSGLNKEGLLKLLQTKYNSISPEKKTALNLLSLYHQSGLVLPMMLVLSQISPSEYANSTLAIHAKYLNGNSELEKKYADSSLAPLKVDWDNPLHFVADLHQQALKTKEFLDFFGPDQSKISVIKELINMGESDNMEFKSSFRWDIRQNKKNPAIEHASLKTMAAFLNSDGGDLLIGVEDDGNILGVEIDNFPNDDKFLLHLWGLIKTTMGQDISPYLKTTLEKFGDKTVCRISCKPSPKPIFLRQKGFDESFYIRIGPSTGSLEISEALKYISEHFPG
jgi:hypothetical protein